MDNPRRPSASHALSQPTPSYRHVFTRERSIHELLGGGRPADILLWRDKHITTLILAGATTLWIVFEWFGCHVLSLVSLAMLSLMGILFVWATVAAFVNRTPPSVPRLQLSEAFVINVAAKFREEINGITAMLYEIAQGKDIKLFLKVESGLWLLSVIGGWSSFLSLVYIVTVLAFTVPALYERHEDKIDGIVQRALQESHKVYEKLQGKVKSIIPARLVKEKKTT